MKLVDEIRKCRADSCRFVFRNVGSLDGVVLLLWDFRRFLKFKLGHYSDEPALDDGGVIAYLDASHASHFCPAHDDHCDHY